ncbi:unnamed protein product [Adineta steineri]|uniref:Uncharacterized protein n=1 Tax=Adineta steineri TaxID=433720 RepID=A0A815HNV1_9BILA|nr:unnamed protein product [Adineta steineri]CAF3530759.1 unnamed protein product [Adineta steineri]
MVLLSMKTFIIFCIIVFNISQYKFESLPCRTNCSNNGTIDNECWREALAYRSSELIKQMFSFASLSVHVDTFQRYHPHEFNDSIKLIDESLEKHLINESSDSHLNINLFTETKQILVNFCRNLTTTQVESVDKIPSLSCSLYTCSSEVLNHLVLLIITAILAGLILIVCMVQFIQMRRRLPSLITIQHANTPLISPDSTNQTSINA